MNDIKVSMRDFLRIYNQALEEMFDGGDCEETGIYGEDVTIHWNGWYCSVGDGATAWNHIISNIESVIEETDEE